MSDSKDHLKDKQYYIDRYDLLTIKECFQLIDRWRELYKDNKDIEDFKKFTPAEKAKNFNLMLNRYLYVVMGEEYRRKKETIQLWMDEDRLKQEKFDNAVEPKGIYCKDCGTLMSSNMKDLDDYSGQALRVLFFFECLKCKKKRGIYEDGDEHKYNPLICPKCKAEVKTSTKRSKGKLTFVYGCTACDFKEVEVDEIEKRREQWKKREEAEKQALAKYREDFCFSEKDGEDYLECAEAIKVGHEVFEEEKKKYDDSAYQIAINLKKLTIVELEKLLNDAIEKEKYTKLSFEKPEMGEYVTVPFSIQDTDSSRKGHISTDVLERLIKPLLEDTNWRLLGSVTYRLGYLEGRLAGYEAEEDLLRISGKKAEQKPKPINQEMRDKYATHHIVQLQRLLGELEGIENTRKKRLEKEPEGFILGESESSLTCKICGQNKYGNEIWWTIEAITCLDCHRNIKEGVIPVEVLSDKDDKIWINQSQISYDHNIHSSSVRKFRREGLLHGRDLKFEDGITYYTIYLVEENKEFLKKYPSTRKKTVITDLLGNKFEL